MNAIPKTMRAVVLTGHGSLDKLEYHEDWLTPQPAAGEVLIKVHACGLNNTDVNTRTAWYSKSVLFQQNAINDVSEQTTGAAFDTANDEDSTWGGASITFPRIQGADAVGTVVAVGAGADESLIGRRS